MNERTKIARAYEAQKGGNSAQKKAHAKAAQDDSMLLTEKVLMNDDQMLTEHSEGIGV